MSENQGGLVQALTREGAESTLEAALDRLTEAQRWKLERYLEHKSAAVDEGDLLDDGDEDDDEAEEEEEGQRWDGAESGSER